jgi:hypothetical protein
VFFSNMQRKSMSKKQIREAIESARDEDDSDKE